MIFSQMHSRRLRLQRSYSAPILIRGQKEVWDNSVQREMEHPKERVPRRRSYTSLKSLSSDHLNLPLLEDVPPIEDVQGGSGPNAAVREESLISSDLPQAQSLKALIIETFLNEIQEEVKEILERICSHETITLDAFEHAVDLLCQITRRDHLSFSTTLAELGLPYQGRQLKVAQQLFEIICCEYIERLTPEQREQISEKARSCRFDRARMVRSIRGSAEEVNPARYREIQLRCLTKLHNAAVLGRFNSMLTTDIAALSQEELYTLHDDINNSPEAISFTIGLNSCERSARIRLKWMAFVTKVNDAVLSNCLSIAQKYADFREGRSAQVPSFEDQAALLNTLSKAISYNSDYYASFNSITAKKLRAKTMWLISELEKSGHLLSYLKHISNRGILNIIYYTYQACFHINRGGNLDDYQWAAIREKMDNVSCPILDGHVNRYEGCVEQYNRVLHDLETITDIHESLSTWKELCNVYHNVAKVHALCDVVGFKELWEKYLGGVHGRDFEDQKKALSLIEERLIQAFQKAGNLKERIRELFANMAIASYANSFNPLLVEQQFEDFYAIHEFGKEIGFSTSFIDVPLLFIYLRMKFEGSGHLKNDLADWKRIESLYRAIVSARLPFGEGTEVVLDHVERRQMFRIWIRDLFVKNSKAYAKTFDPQDFQPNCLDLMFLQSLGRELGFETPFIDYVVLGQIISSFKTLGSLRKDMPKWKTIFGLYSTAVKGADPTESRVQELNGRIASLFNACAERYSAKFKIKDFLPELGDLDLLKQFGAIIGFDTHFIPSRFSQAALEMRRAVHRVKGGSKKKLRKKGRVSEKIKGRGIERQGERLKGKGAKGKKQKTKNEVERREKEPEKDPDKKGDI